MSFDIQEIIIVVFKFYGIDVVQQQKWERKKCPQFYHKLIVIEFVVEASVTWFWFAFILFFNLTVAVAMAVRQFVNKTRMSQYKRCICVNAGFGAAIYKKYNMYINRSCCNDWSYRVSETKIINFIENRYIGEFFFLSSFSYSTRLEPQSKCYTQYTNKFTNQ